jgi:L-asparaginase II
VDAISVAVRRGRVVEAVHRVHAVALQDGAVVASAGDPELVCFLRSSAKPVQALELVRAVPEVDDEQLAIASASHRAEHVQLDAVRRLLDTAGATEGQLECGLQEGRVPEPLYNNCSGKHAGMLAVCRARGWPTAGYPLAEHSLQQAILRDVAEAAETAAGEIQRAVDGCGVVTFALPLSRIALSFARLGELDGGARVLAAMRARPELVGGVGSLDTELMRGPGDWAAKGGAEGLLCAVAGDGLALALKCEDGAMRPLEPALGRFLELLGRAAGDIGAVPLTNSRGETVGEIEALG